MIIDFNVKRFVEGEREKLEDAKHMTKMSFAEMWGAKSAENGKYGRYRRGYIDLSNVPFGAIVAMTNAGVIEPIYDDDINGGCPLFGVLCSRAD